MEGQNKFSIFVPSPYAFLVTCNGQKVINWRELENEARAVTEKRLRLHWSAYWSSIQQNLPNETAVLEDLMRVPVTPSMYYPCPDELAAKAVF